MALRCKWAGTYALSSGKRGSRGPLHEWFCGPEGSAWPARIAVPCARRHQASAHAVHVRHQSVDDDRHCDRREHEGAGDGRERLQPVAEREVDDGERRLGRSPGRCRRPPRSPRIPGMLSAWAPCRSARRRSCSERLIGPYARKEPAGRDHAVAAWTPFGAGSVVGRSGDSRRLVIISSNARCTFSERKPLGSMR